MSPGAYPSGASPGRPLLPGRARSAQASLLPHTSGLWLGPDSICQRPCKHVAPRNKGGRLGRDHPSQEVCGKTPFSVAQRNCSHIQANLPLMMQPQLSEPLAATSPLAHSRRACGRAGDGTAPPHAFADGPSSCPRGCLAQHVPPTWSWPMGLLALAVHIGGTWRQAPALVHHPPVTQASVGSFLTGGDGTATPRSCCGQQMCLECTWQVPRTQETGLCWPGSNSSGPRVLRHNRGTTCPPCQLMAVPPHPRAQQCLSPLPRCPLRWLAPVPRGPWGPHRP